MTHRLVPVEDAPAAGRTRGESASIAAGAEETGTHTLPHSFSSAILPSSRKRALPTPVPRVDGVTYRSSR